MRVAQAVANGMFQVRMRGRLQFTVEQQMPLETGVSAYLVRFENLTPEPTPATATVSVEEVPAVEPVMAATEMVIPAETPQKGVVIEWPTKLSATLRRVKSALSSSNNSVALRAFEAPNRS
jgi:hypothetical protein